MTELTGSGQPIPLGSNYRIRAPGVLGQANLVLRRPVVGTTRSITAAVERPALDRAFASHDMTDVATIDVAVTRQIAVPAGSALRAPGGDDALELEVPAPPAGYDTVVLAVDESGAITWNYPLADDNSIAAPVTRGAGGVVRFRVPRTPAVTPPAGTVRTRSLFGAVGKKILKVLIYPITDRLVGGLVDTFAGKWESGHRPYRLRTVGPDDYTSQDVPTLGKQDPAWQRLGAGRALLFIHGTFSSTHSAFAGLSREDIQSLSDVYGGRLFAFDHFTLSHAPSRNVDELAAMLPDDVPLDVDIICHSRGGLVSREIVERNIEHGLQQKLTVGKVIFVGAANAGTVLTHPDHMVHMIDRMTTAIDVLPDNPATWILEGIITAVKVVGHGGLASLDGLASMNPTGTYLGTLGGAQSGRAQYRGISADFEPKGTPFDRLALKRLAGDALMDRIFENEENDLVVPTAGVGTASGPCFPIPDSDMLRLDASTGVIHTTYFANQLVRDRLKAWATG